MHLTFLDYAIIGGLFSAVLGIGLWASRTSGSSTSAYFLSNKNMPWWLLGFSMVATTFSTDTPNLVTDIVRTNGVSGNWVWWAFLLTGLLTVFVYAQLWRRSDVSTDMEFYELRYGGKPARFLRWFRAFYLGVVFNVMAMAAVTLAAIKIGQVMLGLSPVQTVLIAGSITVVFSAIGGFRGVIYTDFLLFFFAMAGSIGAAIYLVQLPEVGGLSQLLTHENVQGKLSLFPDTNDPNAVVMLLVIPLAVQWWSAWYPGAEPGGGGYIAQRMLAAKNEHHAMGATFFFNVLHYALRPWPWILVALASLVVFPDIQSIQDAFPQVDASKLGQDLAYSAMLTKLPAGLMGLVLASLGAAYMSTISTHLNWGASYLINDVYRLGVGKNASEAQLVRTGRWATLGLMFLSALLALALTSALQLFEIILMFGAGTGLIFILRWFWWRVNAWSEIAAMVSSGITSIALQFGPLSLNLFGPEGVLPAWGKYPLVVATTTFIWLLVTWVTPAESKETLQRFVDQVQPGGPGWKNYPTQKGQGLPWMVPQGITAMIWGALMVYGALFSTGYALYGDGQVLAISLSITGISALMLLRTWRKISRLWR